MRTRRRARSRASPTFSGSRAARPKTGGITSLDGYFPRIRKAYLIGEAAGEFAGTLQGKVPFVVAGTLDRAVELAARDAAAVGTEGTGRAAVAGLRVVRPVPQLRDPRRGVPRRGAQARRPLSRPQLINRWLLTVR